MTDKKKYREERIKNCKDLFNPQENLTKEEEKAIVSTVFFCNPNVLYMYETTHHNMQKIKVQREWLFHITKSHESYNLIVDLSRSKPPNAEIREGIKEYSDWPTIPQVFLKGEFLGGSDILIEMYNSGSLKEKIEIQLAS